MGWGVRRSGRAARIAIVAVSVAVSCLVAAGSVGPTADAAQPTFTFGAAGDHGSAFPAKAVLQAAGAANLDMFLSLGDLSYDAITPPAWCQMVKDNLNIGAGKAVGDPYGETFPFEVVSGNHEGASLDQYLTPSCLPDRAGATVSPIGTYGREFYVDQPAGAPLVRIISTYAGLGYSYSAGFPHYQWVSDAIDSARAAGIKWVVVADHVNYISTGDKTNEVGADLFNLLVAKKVDLVLQGHDHTYQRSKQLGLSASCTWVETATTNTSCITDDGADDAYDKGNGPVLVIDGTGGQPNYPINPSDPEAGYFAKIRGAEAGSTYGFVKVTATGDSLSVGYDNAFGTAYSDHFSITAPAAPPPDPALVLSETFGGVDGSAWPPVWTSSSASGGSATQASGGGQLAFADTSGAWARTTAAGVEPVADEELLTSYRWNATSASAYLSVYLRGTGGWQSAYRPLNGYGLEITPSSGSVNLHKNVNGTRTSLGNAAAGSRVTTAKQWLRFRVVGSQVMFRTWLDGTAEPSTWALSVTDTSLTAAGRLFASLVRSSSNVGAKSVTFDDVTLRKASTTPPPDTTAPTAPTGLAATSTADGTRVDLSWAASTDAVGVSGYRIVRDGAVLPGSVTSTTYADTGRTPGATHTYVVRAFDAAGNVSADSTAATVTTTVPPPPPGVVLSEPFGGADGAAWPAAWTSGSAAGGSVTQAGGGGQLAFADTSGAWARVSASGADAVADEELLTSYRWSATSASAYLSVYLRGSGAWQSAYRPMNGYGLELGPNTAAVNLHKNVNGVKTSLGNAAAGSKVTTAKQWLRFRVVGSQVMFRTWLDGSPEPTTWALSVTDSSLTSAGRLHVSLVRGSSNVGAKSVTLDDLTLTKP